MHASCLSDPKKFIVTAHAQKRAHERGISKEYFLEAITKPDNQIKQVRGDQGGIVYLFVKKIEQRELTIVAEILKTDCFFITGYWK